MIEMILVRILKKACQLYGNAIHVSRSATLARSSVIVLPIVENAFVLFQTAPNIRKGYDAIICVRSTTRISVPLQAKWW